MLAPAPALPFEARTLRSSFRVSTAHGHGTERSTAKVDLDTVNPPSAAHDMCHETHVAVPRLDETLARRMPFNRSQRRICSATSDTPSRNQVVYSSFGAWRPTVVLCERRWERVVLQDSSGDHRNRCLAENRAGSHPPKLGGGGGGDCRLKSRMRCPGRCPMRNSIAVPKEGF